MDERYFTDRGCGSISPRGRTCMHFWGHAGCCAGRDEDAPPASKASERWWDDAAAARQDPPIDKMFRAGVVDIALPGLSGYE